MELYLKLCSRGVGRLILTTKREKVKKTDETDSLSLCAWVCVCTGQRRVYVVNLDQRSFLSFIE